MINSNLAQEEQASSNDTINMILDAHLDFSQLKEKIDILVSLWGVDEEGRKEAVLAIYNAANLSKDDFSVFLFNIFDVESEDQILGETPEETEGLKQSYHFLRRISDHCLGDLEADNPMILQCRPLTTMSDEEIKIQISRFFTDATSSYLQSEYSQLYSEVTGSHIANDNSVMPSTITGSHSASNLNDVNLNYRAPSN